MSLECPVHRWARTAPSRLALSFEREEWNYQRLEKEVEKWVEILSQYGVAPGSRIALLSSSRPELVAIVHAGARLRAAITPLNTRLAETEVSQLLTMLRPSLIVAEQGMAAVTPGALPLEELSTASVSGEVAKSGPPYLEPEATQAILFTSGTSGLPKGAELTVGNFLASATASAQNLGATPKQKWLACLPLFHVGGLAMMTRCAWYGAALILHSRFDPEEVIHSIEQDSVTHLSLVENTLSRILEAQRGRSFPPSLRVALIGGGPVAPALVQRAHQAGLPAVLTYGLTEASSQVCTEKTGEADGLTSGSALPGVQVRITREDGQVAASHQAGEIEVRGPTVMRGYWADLASTARAFRSGWLRTGDLGVLDEHNRLKVFARRTDLILSGGENVYPAEVERALADHQGVAEVAVVGCRDHRWGQVPVAFVVGRGLDPTPEDLACWCRARLAAFKVPRQFVFLQALPRNASGKIDRLALGARVSEPARLGSRSR
jgi:O-succinylbenzoic acid--CoA ligase